MGSDVRPDLLSVVDPGQFIAPPQRQAVERMPIAGST